MQQVLDPFRFLLIVLAGWAKQQQQDINDYLKEENRVLREQVGNKRLRLNDEQRRRLAVRAKKLGHKVLGEVASIVTPGCPSPKLHSRLKSKTGFLSDSCR